MQGDQLPGFGKRQGTQQRTIHDGEHSGVGADPDGQGQQRGHRKHRAAGQRPQSITHILKQRIEEGDGVHLIDLLSNRRTISQLAQRRCARFIRWKAAGDVFLRLNPNVGLDLFGPVPIPLRAPQEAPKAHLLLRGRPQNSADGPHHLLPSRGLYR